MFYTCCWASVKINTMDYEEKIKQLKQLLATIKDETETYIDHEKMVKDTIRELVKQECLKENDQ